MNATFPVEDTEDKLPSPLTVFLIEPYFRGSHASWAKGLQAHSQHKIEIFSHSGNFWKWRMHGAAVSLAKEVKAKSTLPDVLLVSDMLDLATFRALCGSAYSHIPAILYFHENQLVYPWSPTDRDTSLKRDRHYAFINYTSSLVANQICFNSTFHMKAFLDALPIFLREFPDHQETDNVKVIREKSSVIHLGVDLGKGVPHRQRKKEKPVILWNHRWEYDKNPDEFFEVLIRLKNEGIPFSLVLLGESFQKIPDSIRAGKEALVDHILHEGFVANKTAYEELIQKADILPVTSHHDFFGISVVEAIGEGVYPLLPDRCAYPEHIPSHLQHTHIYKTSEELYEKLKAYLLSPEPLHQDLTDYINRYNWPRQITAYDEMFLEVVSSAVK